jgi:hypothetical protein
MPKTPIDYSKTILYKIVCNDLNIKDVYIGHTTDFVRRQQSHKGNCCNPEYKSHRLKVYQFITDNGGWNNWEMIEIEKYPCNDANEARSRERYWFETLNATLNSRFPLRNKNEYRETNKDVIKEKDHNYYQKNKEEILLRVHQYANDNKDKIKERMSSYRAKYSDQIKAFKGAVELCECGIYYTHAHKQRHFRTNLHQKLMKCKNQAVKNP